MMRTASKGFTLAELLIALAILGVIATFTIPKILDSSTNGKLTSIAKETASMISGAYSSYKQTTTPAFNMMSLGTSGSELGQYMNYVRIDTATATTAFQTPPGGANFTEACAATTPCYVLHNGAYLQMGTAATFGATNPAPNNPAATTALVFNVDPDGTGAQAGAVSFILYYNGRLTTRGTLGADVTGGTQLTQIASDPSWIANWN